MNNLPPIIARALAPFTPPERPEPEPPCLYCGNAYSWRDKIWCDCGKLGNAPPSLVVDCPACDGGWRDTPTGVVMCGQCMGTGRRATNGGEV